MLPHLALGLGDWKPQNASEMGPPALEHTDRARQEENCRGGYLVSLNFLQFCL